MRITVLLPLVLIALLSAAKAGADNASAVADWQAGRHDEAIAEWRKMAESGDSVAQYNLAVHYLNGEGVPQNRSVAIDWLRRAAQRGSLRSMELLGTLLISGGAYTPVYSEALTWLSLAAKAGSALAANNLAVVYAEGRGVPVDLVRAYNYAVQTAKGGIDSTDLRAEIEKHMNQAQLAAVGRAALPEPKPESAVAHSAWLVHLASVSKATDIEIEWRRQVRRTPQLLQFEPIYAIITQPSGKTVTRIFIGGFSDRDTAKTFCDEFRRRRYCLVTDRSDFK